MDANTGICKGDLDYNMDEVHIEVSMHAEKRMIERLGINKRAVQRLAEKAYKDGIRHKDAVGRLKKWMTYRFSQNRNANNMRVYGEFLYVFCGNILVTVYIVPNELRKLVSISAKNKNACSQDIKNIV